MDVLIAKNFKKKIIKTDGIFALTMFGYNYCWQCANEDNSCNKCCHSTNMQIFFVVRQRDYLHRAKRFNYN